MKTLHLKHSLRYLQISHGRRINFFRIRVSGWRGSEFFHRFSFPRLITAHAPLLFCLLTKISRNSQPFSRSFFTCFNSLGAFRQSPSAITRHAPPRSRFVPTRGRSLYPVTSSSSVPSPLMQIGQCFVIFSISSTEGVYCRCCTLL